MALRYCRKCKLYTLKNKCTSCGKSTKTPHPYRFSPEDRHGEYRRKLKLEAAGGTGNG